MSVFLHIFPHGVWWNVGDKKKPLLGMTYCFQRHLRYLTDGKARAISVEFTIMIVRSCYELADFLFSLTISGLISLFLTCSVFEATVKETDFCCSR